MNWKRLNETVKKAAIKLTPDQAAEVAVQGMFAKADRDRAARFKRAGKLDAAKKAEARADAPSWH